MHLGFLFYVETKYEHSIAQFRKVLEMNPQYYLAHAWMGNVYALAGQFDAALACYARAREADANSKFVDSLEAMTLALAGRRDEAAELLEKITLRAVNDYISPVSIAYISHGAGRQGSGVRESGSRDFRPRPEHSRVEIKSDLRDPAD